MRVAALTVAAVIIFGAVFMSFAYNAKADEGKIVRVGWFDSTYCYRDQLGRRSGLAYEYQQKVAAYTGWTYEYVEGTWPELMQIYTDLHYYNTASAIMGKINQISGQSRVGSQNQAGLKVNYHEFDDAKTHPDYISQVNQKITQSDTVLAKYGKLFIGREDMFATFDIIQGRKTRTAHSEPLDYDVLKEHLNGKLIAATFLQRPNATVHQMVIDVDVSRKILLQSNGDEQYLNRYLKKAAEKTLAIGKVINDKGLKCRYEFSGRRGYHIWLFFQDWLPVRYVNMLQDLIDQEIQDVFEDGDISNIESAIVIKPSKLEQRIKKEMNETIYSQQDIDGFYTIIKYYKEHPPATKEEHIKNVHSRDYDA